MKRVLVINNTYYKKIYIYIYIYIYIDTHTLIISILVACSTPTGKFICWFFFILLLNFSLFIFLRGILFFFYTKYIKPLIYVKTYLKIIFFLMTNVIMLIVMLVFSYFINHDVTTEIAITLFIKPCIYD